MLPAYDKSVQLDAVTISVNGHTDQFIAFACGVSEGSVGRVRTDKAPKLNSVDRLP